MSEENQRNQYLSRSEKKRRNTKEHKDGDQWGGLLNFLIAIVGLLLIVAIILILTNTNVKDSLKKEDHANEPLQEENQSSDKNGHADSATDEGESEQNEGAVNGGDDASDETSNQNNTGANDSDGSQNNEDNTDDENIQEQLQHITTVSSDDPNVSVAWIDSRWIPLETEQTGSHISAFDLNHIDYQEKLKLLYRDTGFTEEDSIVWNVKNASGNAIAVISSKNKQHIFRLTMKWVPNKGWQTILIEQLISLEGAY